MSEEKTLTIEEIIKRQQELVAKGTLLMCEINELSVIISNSYPRDKRRSKS